MTTYTEPNPPLPLASDEAANNLMEIIQHLQALGDLTQEFCAVTYPPDVRPLLRAIAAQAALDRTALLRIVLRYQT